MHKVILKEGREVSLKRRHPWIFSGALKSLPKIEPGEMLPVESSKGERMGWGYFNPGQSLTGRMVTFKDEDPKLAIANSLKRAVAFRKQYVLSAATNACRLVNAEADMLPGLIVDKYGDVLVLQIGTYGMERLREEIVSHLTDLLKPRAIVEISQSSSRVSEGLPPVKQTLLGEAPEEITCLEDGIQIVVPILKGQKTGYFLDQRENRSFLKRISSEKKVLNCFSYTGGFTLNALAGGAKEVVSVDVSESALEMIPKQMALNQFDAAKSTTVCEDVFSYISRSPLDHDIVILDPPAFAKKKKDLVNALKGYRNLNRAALEKMKSGAILLTCSCSYFVSREDFEKTVKEALLQAGREAQFLSPDLHAWDHPTSLFCPETSYLKCLWLRIF